MKIGRHRRLYPTRFGPWVFVVLVAGAVLAYGIGDWIPFTVCVVLAVLALIGFVGADREGITIANAWHRSRFRWEEVDELLVADDESSPGFAVAVRDRQGHLHRSWWLRSRRSAGDRAHYQRVVDELQRFRTEHAG